MEEVFSILFAETNDSQSFENSLEKNFQATYDFFNAPYQIQYKHKEEIEHFILLKNKAISGSSFQTSESRSFLLILLDLCERFALYSSIPRIIRIIQNNDIYINKRVTAALKYLYPSPSSNDELLDRFDEICLLLDEAITEEEDNASKSIITFLNYYSHIVYNTDITYATCAKDKLLSIISSHKYSWLEQINDIANLDISDLISAYNIIEKKIDEIYSRLNLTISTDCNYEDLLIEKDTDYCNELANVPKDFLSIRKISVKYADGNLNGRGVSMLETESEMFEYIKRFGKMHYAKLLSSFELSFPQEFSEPVNIIDWGCGQGLASMTFIEKYGESSVNNIVLIEPSEIVIKRAALHCLKFAPKASIRTICKKLDEVELADINLNLKAPTIHLFSNILDIDGYSTGQLLNLITANLSSMNYFVCVSPYIDEIKTARLDTFMKFFYKYPTFTLYHDIENTKNGNFWLCNNSFQKEFISHGKVSSCREYDTDGCLNKWTRVLKVFSV